MNGEKGSKASKGRSSRNCGYGGDESDAGKRRGGGCGRKVNHGSINTRFWHGVIVLISLVVEG